MTCLPSSVSHSSLLMCLEVSAFWCRIMCFAASYFEQSFYFFEKNFANKAFVWGYQVNSPTWYFDVYTEITITWQIMGF